MKSRIAHFAGIALLLIMISPFCTAVGFGAYASYDHRISTLAGTFMNNSDFERSKLGQYGIVFDTNVAKDSGFNYRLNLGIDFSTISFYDQYVFPPGNVTMDIWKIMIENSFGFGIVRSQFFRLWAGPQVGIGLGFEPTSSNEDYYTTNGSYFEWDLHVGFVMGLNVHLGDSVSLCADIGARLHENIMVSEGGSFFGFISDYFANASVILRAGDVFTPPAPPATE